MGWAHGVNARGEDIGYAVPAVCEHPGCTEKIDKGLAHVCGGEHDGGAKGCGHYFCEQHLFLGSGAQLCAACDGAQP